MSDVVVSSRRQVSVRNFGVSYLLATDLESLADDDGFVTGVTQVSKFNIGPEDVVSQQAL